MQLLRIYIYKKGDVMKKQFFLFTFIFIITITSFSLIKNDSIKIPDKIFVIEQTQQGNLLVITAIDLSNNELIILQYACNNYLKDAFELINIVRTGIKTDPNDYKK